MAEKNAYDYAYEAAKKERYYKNRSKGEPVSAGKSIKTLLPVTAVTGAAIGGIAGGVRGLLPGAAIGAVSAIPVGFAASMINRFGHQRAQRIMSMPPKEREAYLRALAREEEIRAREYREDVRTKQAAHETVGFLKEAGPHTQWGVKLLNKAKQVAQGSARGDALAAAKASRSASQTARAARGTFGGHVKVDVRGAEKMKGVHRAAKERASRVGRRNALIAGAGAAVGLGTGYAAS